VSSNALTLLLVSLALLAIGSEMVVRGASRLAASLGITPMILGLTVVSIGTSMPELVVGITASRQGSGGLAVGNIAGTNVFSILFILGLTCLASPAGLPVERQLLLVDIPMMAGVALLRIPVFASGRRVSRVEGGAYIAIYVAYMLWLTLLRA
jgi:cation:H+ antiporter